MRNMAGVESLSAVSNALVIDLLMVEVEEVVGVEGGLGVVACMCHGVPVEVRGQLAGVGFLLCHVRPRTGVG